MSEELITADQQKLLEEVKAFCSEDQIVSVTVSNEAELRGASEFAKRLKSYDRQLESERKAAKEPFLQKGKDVDSTFGKVRELVGARVKAIMKGVNDFKAAVEAKRLEAQRRADEAARKERERMEEQAAKQRAKEEAARKEAEEAARKAAEAEDEQERQKLEAEARKKQAQADKAARDAETKQKIASTVVAPVIESEAPDIKGVSKRANWRADVTDKVKFIQWAIKNEEYQYIDINMPNLNKYAKMIKDTKDIPGVRVWNDETDVLKG